MSTIRKSTGSGGIEPRMPFVARMTKFWPLIAAGRIKPLLYQTLPLTQAAEAHRLMESATHTGKIMLAVG